MNCPYNSQTALRFLWESVCSCVFNPLPSRLELERYKTRLFHTPFQNARGKLGLKLHEEPKPCRLDGIELQLIKLITADATSAVGGHVLPRLAVPVLDVTGLRDTA